MKEKEKCMGNIPIEDKKAARYIIIFMTVAIVIFSAISLLLEKSVNLKESELSSIMSNMQNSVSGMIENEDIKKISPGAHEYIKKQMQEIDKEEFTKKTYNEINKYRKKIYWIRSGIKVIIFVGAALLILRKEVKIRSEKEKEKLAKEVIKEKAIGLKELLRWPKKIPKLVYYILGFGILLIIIIPQVADKFVNIDQIADTIYKKGMNKKNIIFVYSYIAIVNSFIEELMFRGIGYIELKKHIPEKYACSISAMLFALYHIAIVNGTVNIWLTILSVVALYIAGVVLNKMDKKTDTILPSYMVHSLSNWILNIIGYLIVFV